MSPKKTATVEEPKGLPAYEGIDVDKATVKITNAGDGLSDALKFEPVALHHGDEVFFVLKGKVVKVTHEPEGKVELDDDIDELVRVHVVKTFEIAMVDEFDVSELLAKNRERIKKRKDEEAGVMNLFPDAPDADALAAAHGAGEHTDLVEGCEDCDEEARAEAAAE